MKKCPFCAEDIQDEAIKCRYCGSVLDKLATIPAKFSPGCAVLAVIVIVGFLSVNPFFEWRDVFFFIPRSESSSKSPVRLSGASKVPATVAGTPVIDPRLRLEAAGEKAAADFPMSRSAILARLSALELAAKKQDWGTAEALKAQIESDLRPLLNSPIAAGPDVMAIRLRFESVATVVVNRSTSYRPTFPSSAPATENTPEQTASARRVMASIRGTATVTEDSTALLVTFNYGVDRETLYKVAETVVIADQVLTAENRYIHFYDPTHREVATFSPVLGLKLVE